MHIFSPLFLISKSVFTWSTELDSFHNQHPCWVFPIWGFWHILSMFFIPQNHETTCWTSAKFNHCKHRPYISFYCHDLNIFGLSNIDSSSSKQRRLVLSRKSIVTIVLLLQYFSLFEIAIPKVKNKSNFHEKI